MFTFVKLLELEKSISAGHKKNLLAVVGISVGRAHCSCNVRSFFVAVNTMKDTAVSRCIDDEGWLSPTFDHCPGYSIPAV